MFRIRFHNSKAAFTHAPVPHNCGKVWGFALRQKFVRKDATATRRQGFTLVELIAVIVVLGICLAPFGILFHHVMASYAKPEAIQVATALAEEEMERVTALRYSKVVNEGPTVFTNYPNFRYQVIVSPISGEPNTDEYKQVEMRVTNDNIGITVSLFTIVTIKQNVS